MSSDERKRQKLGLGRVKGTVACAHKSALYLIVGINLLMLILAGINPKSGLRTREMTMNAYIPRRDYYANADGPESKITVPANSEVDEATRRFMVSVYTPVERSHETSYNSNRVEA